MSETDTLPLAGVKSPQAAPMSEPNHVFGMFSFAAPTIAGNPPLQVPDISKAGHIPTRPILTRAGFDPISFMPLE
jgi:hypothetical protein